jgi:hypothetical protein
MNKEREIASFSATRLSEGFSWRACGRLASQ